jgi:peptide/nickel transport system substrate-binding protein
MRLGRFRARALAFTAAAAAVAVVAGCGNGGGAGTTAKSGPPVKGGTATVAEISGDQADWIFPFDPPAYFSVYNTEDFQYLMYRPLYLFGGENTQVTVNYPLSPAQAPQFTDGGTKIVINLKGWKWSNGETVDAADVIFWMHMMEAEKANWAAYAAGQIPDNVRSVQATGPDQVTFTLTGTYSSYWYTYNELSQITPMPMSWDVTKLGAAPGSGGCTTDSAADHWAKCVAVYNFLSGQSKDTGSYGVPGSIWSVSDGPWRLSSFNTSGNITFVPNPDYSGSPKPHLSAVKFVPFTSATAIYTALQTGNTLSYGPIPEADLPQKPVGQAVPSSSPLPSTYTLEPRYEYSIAYYITNFNNPVDGPVFRQLYIRQALEYLDDQEGMAKTIYRGYGYPTTGAVPTEPASDWVPSAQQGAGPYPFSIAKAASLLASHGWTKENGVMTCTNPSQCGPGVPKGFQLKFSFDYSSGSPVFAQEAQIYKSDAAQAGIVINANAQTFNTIEGEAVPCSGPKCTWQMLMFGSWLYSPDYEPTGEEIFATGAGSNNANYSDPTMNKLITETNTSSSLSVFDNYANYAAEQLPYIWMPNNYQIEAVQKSLHGVVFNPLDTFVPEYWYYTKS